MTEPTPPPLEPSESLPSVEIATRSRLSSVWLVPLVALLIGGWLAYRTYAEQGVEIAIRFDAAAGLVAGKTKVKYRDVDIGEVTSIVVSEDLKHVVVHAQLVAGAKRYLTAGTRFWVARPRVSVGRVTGLETLLSGAYIAMDPVIEGLPERQFTGLEEPPLFTTSESGKQFLLKAESGGSLNPGSPVYYRSIQVGQVVSSELESDGQMVNIKLFIASPQDRLVLTTTRFWNASGVDFQLGVDGLRIDTESLLSMMLGGIAFDNPQSLEEAGTPAAEGQAFRLYASRDQAHEIVYEEKDRYLLFFDGSVRGLEIDAPVMLRGIQIGRVLDVKLKFSMEEFRFLIPVLIEIEPQRIGRIGNPAEERQNIIPRLVANGLRGQLKSASLLTGQLYIDLDFHRDAPLARLSHYGEHVVIPTVPATLDALTNKLNQILDTLLALPLEQIGQDLGATVAGTKRLANSAELAQSLVELQALLASLGEMANRLDREALPELQAALRQARQTLKATEDLMTPGSPLYAESRRTLTELAAAARSLRLLADYLERHPEALIQGKGR